MRVWSTLSGSENLRGGKQRPQPDRVPCELVHAALLAVDHAHRSATDEAHLAERSDRREEGPAGGHDVLHDTHLLARTELPLEPLGGAVVLHLLADEEEPQPGGSRARGGERDCAEPRPRE